MKTILTLRMKASLHLESCGFKKCKFYCYEEKKLNCEQHKSYTRKVTYFAVVSSTKRLTKLSSNEEKYWKEKLSWMKTIILIIITIITTICINENMWFLKNVGTVITHCVFLYRTKQIKTCNTNKQNYYSLI